MSHRYLHAFIVPVLVFLGGCSIGGVTIPNPLSTANTDFASMYRANISDTIESMRSYAKDMGYRESYEAQGMLRIVADIPMILSGAIETGYDAKVHGQDADVTFTNPQMRYETFIASGSVVAKEIAMIASG